MKKTLFIFALSIATLLCSCSTSTSGNYENYDDRYDRSYKSDYEEGYEKGCADGYDMCELDNHDTIYDSAYDAGYDNGFYDYETSIDTELSELSQEEWTDLVEYYTKKTIYFEGSESLDDHIGDHVYVAFVLGYYANQMGLETIYGFHEEDRSMLEWYFEDYDVQKILDFAASKGSLLEDNFFE